MEEVKHALGAVVGPVDVRDYKATCAAKDTDFPTEFEIYRPPVKDQRQINACVAFAISSVVEYFNRVQEGTYVKMSTDYIYGNRTMSTHTGQGMIVSQALHTLIKYGDCPENMFSGNTEMPGAMDKFKEKVESVIADAYPNRITSYFTLIGDNAMKANLMENGPIIIAANWYNDTDYERGILNFHRESGYAGRHCMFIYGWNETGWKVANSWGILWGNKGNCIIPFGEDIAEVYGVKDNIMSDKVKDAMIEELRAKILEFDTKNAELMHSIEENTKEISELSNKISELSVELFNLEAEKAKLGTENEGLSQVIKELKEEIASNLKIIDALKEQIEILTEQKEEYEAQITDYKKTIMQLNQKLLDIKKPFNSKIGQVVAKIINAIINLFKKKEV